MPEITFLRWFLDFIASLEWLAILCALSRLRLECLRCGGDRNALMFVAISSALQIFFPDMCQVPCFPIFNLLLDRRLFTSVLCWRMWHVSLSVRGIRQTYTFIDAQSVWACVMYNDGHRFPFWNSNLLCHFYFYFFFQSSWISQDKWCRRELTKTLIWSPCGYRMLRKSIS